MGCHAKPRRGAKLLRSGCTSEAGKAPTTGPLCPGSTAVADVNPGSRPDLRCDCAPRCTARCIRSASQIQREIRTHSPIVWTNRSTSRRGNHTNRFPTANWFAAAIQARNRRSRIRYSGSLRRAESITRGALRSHGIPVPSSACGRYRQRLLC